LQAAAFFAIQADVARGLRIAFAGFHPRDCYGSQLVCERPTAMKLEHAVQSIQQFCGQDLGGTLAVIEGSLCGATILDLAEQTSRTDATSSALAAAGPLKRLAGQINVVIHAAGILRCLPLLLDPNEIIEYVSLGAGNTGRPFDLATNKRIAEFKFTAWRGGAESIRQNNLFKDLFLLAEYEDPRKKFLYVLGIEQPLKFFNGRRALSSVLSRDEVMRAKFVSAYGTRYQTVRDYYSDHNSRVVIEDVSHLGPELVGDSLFD
jgi:hypothetical protein